MRDLNAVLDAIDAANTNDPTDLDGTPLALAQGRLATQWLAKLCPTASDELQVAARAHHLRRWEVSRQDYPEGRSGYLRWRKDNKAHQASEASEILRAHDWDPTAIDRVAELLHRKGLRTDTDTQHLEDVACLVFLETQLASFSHQVDPERLEAILTKSLAKMSPPARALAASLNA